MSAPRVLFQLIAFLAFFAVVGYFSASPSYSPFAPDSALLRVSFSHAGDRVEPCRRFTPDEIAQMAPNMRRAMDCVRERVALRLLVTLNGRTALDRELPPAGLSRDGASTVYARIAVPPGEHVVVAKLRDSRRTQGFDHVDRFELTVSAGDSRVLGFSQRKRSFELL